MRYTTLVIFILICSLIANADTKEMIFGGTRIVVTSKRKIFLFAWPDYRAVECGIKMKVLPSTYIGYRRSKNALSFTPLPDTFPEPLIFIDSCFQSLKISEFNVDLCRLNVYGHKMLVAKFYLPDGVLTMCFKKEEYNYAMEILASMRIRFATLN